MEQIDHPKHNGEQIPPSFRSRLLVPLRLVLVLAVIVALVRWSGLPQANRSLFLIGVVTLLAVLAAGFWLAWYLLLKPLPAQQTAPRAGMAAGPRRVLAVLLAVSAVSIVVGGVWDEVWHRRYGLPFGEDLLWRPHLMIYLGLLLIGLCALYGLWHMWRRGQGSLRQRFRAEPLVGALVLVGAFLLYALPADPLWHMVYGADISAWSLPHLVLMLSFGLVMVLAAALQLSTLPARPWRGPLAVRAEDALVFVALAFALLQAVQLFTTEWDTVRVIRENSPHVFWRRPAWLLPALVAGLGGFFGTLALHATRLVGAASLMGLLALACRYLLLRAFAFEQLSADAWLLVLPPLVVLDLWYGARLVRLGRASIWPGAGIAAAVGLAALSLPLMQTLYVYPRVNAQTLPSMLLALLVTAVCAAWAGAGVGDYLAAGRARPDASVEMPSRLRWVAPSALIAMLGFIVVFIATASPPV